MTAKTLDDLRAAINAAIPDNVARLVDPVDVRQTGLIDSIDSLADRIAITPQMFGAVGDWDGASGTDDSLAIQQAADFCNALNSPNITKPTLLFPRGTGEGYLCNTTITVKENIHIVMDSDIVHGGSQSTAGLVIGTNTIINGSMEMRLRVARTSTSDWTNEGSIGIKLINFESCTIWLWVGIGGGFTIGLQCMGSGTGFSNNTVTIGRLIGHGIGIDLTNENNGFCNENRFFGGRIGVGSGDNTAASRVGVRVTSSDKLNTSTNRNSFYRPNFELKNSFTTGDAEALCFDVVHGQENICVDARNEDSGPIFAKVRHFAARTNVSNHFEAASEDAKVEQIGNAFGNTFASSSRRPSYLPLRLIFDSGQMEENAVAFDADKTFIPNVHTAFTSNDFSEIAQSNIDFSVSEEFLTDEAADNDKLLDTAHTLKNGDRVFLTGGDLPDGLLTGQLYFVVQAETNAFKLSIDLNGVPVTFSDDGTGPHTYHSRNRYLQIANGTAVGIRVDTTVAKNFILERDIEETRPGRVHLRAYDADDNILSNREEFAVDVGTNELIQSNHTLVVGDAVTFTTNGTLPDPLAVLTDFFVISINDTAAGRFKVSETDGGTEVEILDVGTGTQTYNLEYPYAVSPRHAWNPTAYGGVYLQNSDFAGELNIRAKEETKSIDILIAGASNPLHIRRFRLYVSDKGVEGPDNLSPRTYTAYDAQPDQALVTQVPTFGVYFRPMVIWDETPTVGGPPAFVLEASGAPGTWLAMANLA